ncbi:MAG: glycosyltransferase family 4 protein [Candidatus Riflebacteria bacterium]|nr:glycosyltransferase family 4 protein [Candidatus Riflebacteria bacterium]
MKILFISNLYPPHYLGGYEILCSQVIKEMQLLGHETIVLTSNHGLQTQDSIPGIHRLLSVYPPFGKPPDISRFRRFSQSRLNQKKTENIISSDNFDAIFVWSQLRLSLGPARAAEKSGLPVFFTFNDDHLAGYLPARFCPTPLGIAKYLRDRLIFEEITTTGLKFENTTCISQTLKDNLLARGLQISDSRVIFQGIPVELFPQKDDPGSLHSPLRLLYVGQLHEYKGVHIFLEGAARFARKNAHQIEIKIAGEGPEEYKNRLAELAKEIDGRVIFLGRIPHSELPQLYRESDIFVFPSLWKEPFGLTHLEAIASGIPVISTNDGGHGEFLKDRENCLIFEKGNSAQLSEKILELSSNKDLRNSVILTARETVEKDFSLKRYSADLEKFICEKVRTHGIHAKLASPSF